MEDEFSTFQNKVLTIQEIRKILKIFSENLQKDSELEKIENETFNLSSLYSKWINRKKKMLLFLINIEDQKKIIKENFFDNIDEVSDEIIPNNIKEKRLKQNKEYKELFDIERLIHLSIDLCDEAKETLKIKGFQIKNRIEWTRWIKGTID